MDWSKIKKGDVYHWNDLGKQCGWSIDAPRNAVHIKKDIPNNIMYCVICAMSPSESVKDNPRMKVVEIFTKPLGV